VRYVVWSTYIRPTQPKSTEGRGDPRTYPYRTTALTPLSARARLARLKAEFKTLFVAVGMSLVSACTAWQTQENALDQISTINNMRYSQLLTNSA
jgi:hypothetical protein